MPIEKLKLIVGSGGWKSSSADLEPHLHEWRGLFTGKTPLLVAPASTQEVAEVVRVCADAGIGIVPQGGNTGMCGGAVPDASNSQIILSMSRMNRIIDVDAANFSMEVEAGCILQNVQNAANKAGCYFPLSLGAEGSCQIGGNLAANAGGINVLRYGNARQQVLGLEVVLADGSIVDGVRALRKDTAGYDLKQLFIGSEGTLGIITRAVLKLVPQPGPLTTAMMTLQSSGQAVDLLSFLQRELPDSIEAFELISDHNLQLVLEYVPGARTPFGDAADWYVLMHAAMRDREEDLQAALTSAIERGLVDDVVIAKSEAESEALWHLRHSISAAERAGGRALKHDISVPLSRMQEFLERGDALLAELVPDAQLFAFGHVGDGNLHYNVRLPEGFVEDLAVTAAIYDLVADVGGSFSAEHGVGQIKKDWLPRYRGGAELALMKSLKKTLDPANILNPGKIF